MYLTDKFMECFQKHCICNAEETLHLNEEENALDIRLSLEDAPELDLIVKLEKGLRLQ